MSSANNRVYRPIQSSDLVKVSSGELKAFYYYKNDNYFPVKLASSRLDRRDGLGSNLWIIDGNEFDNYIRGDQYILIDVTPEKRYAIWDHKKQRFLKSLSNGDIRTGADKTAMEVWVQEYCTKYGFSNKDYYIVEWEIKNDQ